MDDQTLRLVETIRDQIAKSAREQGLRPTDCCWTCRTASMSIWQPRQQPPEVWEPLVRSIAGSLIWWPLVQLERSIKACESPLEELLFLSLVHEARNWERLHFDGSDCVPFEAYEAIAIRPQVVFGQYRVDFLVRAGGRFAEKDVAGGGGTERWHQATVIVEVDGHEFHEKTKEQASRDKKRDRQLQAAGLSVLRYTGRDVWTAPLDCAREALDTAWALAQKSMPIQSRSISSGPERPQ